MANSLFLAGLQNISIFVYTGGYFYSKCRVLLTKFHEAELETSSKAIVWNASSYHRLAIQWGGSSMFFQRWLGSDSFINYSFLRTMAYL